MNQTTAFRYRRRGEAFAGSNPRALRFPNRYSKILDQLPATVDPGNKATNVWLLADKALTRRPSTEYSDPTSALDRGFGQIFRHADTIPTCMTFVRRPTLSPTELRSFPHNLMVFPETLGSETSTGK